MKCVNGHVTENQVKFCPECGTTSFEPESVGGSTESVRTENPAESSSSPMVTTSSSAWYRNGFVIVALAIVVAGAILAVVVATKNTVPPTTTTTTTVPLSGPTVGYMQSTTLKDFNKQFGTSATQSQCAYSPRKWSPSYSFTCFIYSQSSTGVGTVDVTSTSPVTANQFTWNESFNQF